jgi:hypothetical protein
MTAPRQMIDHTLNALKGWPAPHALDYAAQLSDAIPEVNLPVLSGQVGRLNTAGKFELGLATNVAMPLFAFPNSDDPDIENDGGDPATDAGVFVSVTPSGKLVFLVATGAYELTSTEFVAGTYNPNVLLSSDDAGDDMGNLRVGVISTDTICGVVSRVGAGYTNGYGKPAIAFWPVFIPAGV